MKPQLLLALMLALNRSFAADDSQRELNFSETGVQFALVPGGSKLSPERVSVVVTNRGSRSGTFRLPSPYVAEDPNGFAPYPPYLALRVKEMKTGSEEVFVLTSLRKPDHPGELVYLKPGQVRKFEHPLMLFYRWGPCSPADGNFKECFSPGDSELEVRAEVFLVEKSGPRSILSNAQTLRCSIPEWLFKGTSKDNATAGKPDGNPGSGSKPEPKPGATNDSKR